MKMILVLLLVSCSNIGLNTGSKPPRQTPHQKVESLVNEGKFDEAKKVAEELRVPAYLGVKRVEASAKCQPVVNECSAKDRTQQDTRRCLNMLKDSCEKKYLTIKNLDEFNVTWNSLVDEKEKSSSKDKGRCNDGLKWGYIRETGPNLAYKAFTHNVDYKSLHGEFNTKEKCEEARLLETSKVQTSDICHVRYLGETKKIILHETIAMNKTTKASLYFSDKNKCEQAVHGGFKYYSEEDISFSISPKDSSNSSRFIKECEQKEIVICEKYKQGEIFLHDIF